MGCTSCGGFVAGMAAAARAARLRRLVVAVFFTVLLLIGAPYRGHMPRPALWLKALDADVRLPSPSLNHWIGEMFAAIRPALMKALWEGLALYPVPQNVPDEQEPM
jgi:hypothetical protein